jgi:hypothetical protein
MTAPNAPSQPDVPNSKLAIASLVFGVLSLFGVMPFFGGAIAIILGYIAKSEIDGSLGSLQGTRLATAGQILGAVHIVGAVILTCCGLAYIMFGQYLPRFQ